MLYNLCRIAPGCELRTQPAAGFVHIALVGFVLLFSTFPQTTLLVVLSSHILSGYPLLHSPISFPHPPFHHHRGLFILSSPCLFAISFPSLLLYSLLGPRWLIVYATNFSLFNLATNSQALLPHVLASLAPFAKPDWYPTPKEPR